MMFFKNVGPLHSSGLLNQVSLEESSLSNAAAQTMLLSYKMQQSELLKVEERKEKRIFLRQLCVGGGGRSSP